MNRIKQILRLRIKLIVAFIKPSTLLSTIQISWVKSNSEFLSTSDSSLEKELKLTLFSLNNKKISLTFEGQLLYNKIAPFIEISDGLFKNFSTFAKDASQVITIATHVALSSKVLPQIITKFLDINPLCRVVIKNTNKLDGIKMLNQCEVDCLFFQLNETDVNQNLQPLTRFNYKTYDEVIILGKNNPLALKDEITISDLQKMNFLVLKDNVAISEFEFFAKNNNLKSQIEIEYGSWETLVRFVAGSRNCITMLDRFYVDNNPDIVVKKNNFFKTNSTYQFCALKNNSKNILNSFLDIAKSFC